METNKIKMIKVTMEKAKEILMGKLMEMVKRLV